MSKTKPAMPEGAFWNNIRRAWMVERDGETALLDPQPPPAPNDGVTRVRIEEPGPHKPGSTIGPLYVAPAVKVNL